MVSAGQYSPCHSRLPYADQVSKTGPEGAYDYAMERRPFTTRMARISGPLLDRIDLHIEVPAVKFRELAERADGESSAIASGVERCREVQLERFKGTKIHCNAHMPPPLHPQVLRT